MSFRTGLLAVVACLALGCGEKSTGPTAAQVPVVLQTIAELSFPNAVQAGPAILAQSVTLPPGGSFNNIRFRFTPSPGAPPLAGALYIIDREYLGPVSAVNTAPGLVARSIRIEGGEYVFGPAVMLTGGTKYWFGTDTSVGYLCSQPTSDVYPGGELYFQGSLASGETSYAAASLFSPNDRIDAGFTLRGVRLQ